MQSLHHHSVTLTLHTDVTFAFLQLIIFAQLALLLPAHEEEDEGDDAEDADDDGDAHEDRGGPEGRGENRPEVIQTASADISSILAEI